MKNPAAVVLFVVDLFAGLQGCCLTMDARCRKCLVDI